MKRGVDGPSAELFEIVYVVRFSSSWSPSRRRASAQPSRRSSSSTFEIFGTLDG